MLNKSTSLAEGIDVAKLITIMIEQFAWNESSLLLENVLQTTQTLLLFTMNILNKKYIQKLLKC